MSNGRRLRRGLAVSRKAIGKRRDDRAAGRWPFGGPSISSVRRWLNQLVEAGEAEKTVMHTGKPGRPAYGYKITEKGLAGPADERTYGEAITDVRVERILRQARGKALTEDEIVARYEKAMVTGR